MKYSFLIFGLFLSIALFSQAPTVNNWQYIEIDDDKGKWGDRDDPNWLRYFGLDMGDVDLDVLGKPYTWQAPRLDIWLNVTGED